MKSYSFGTRGRYTGTRQRSGKQPGTWDANRGLREFRYTSVSTLRALVVRAVHKVVTSPKSIRRLWDAVIDNTRFAAPVAALVKLEKRKPVTKQTKIEVRCRKFIKADVNMNLRTGLASSEGSKQQRTDFSDDKTNSWVYSIQHSKLGNDIDCYKARLWQAVLFNKNSEPYKTVMFFVNMIKYPSDAPAGPWLNRWTNFSPISSSIETTVLLRDQLDTPMI